MSILLHFVRLLLLPFSLLFGLASEIRNLLFDWGILPVYRSRLPVISVGNIQAGGTGKTPFTIWLARKLSDVGRVAVVSRGYGRKSKGLKVVYEKGKVLCDAITGGDEPLLIAHKARPEMVVVAEKRKEALHHLEVTESADLVILDDGFQHRWVARQIDIVLFKRTSSLWQKLPLPSGFLREFPWRLKRAHFLLLSGKSGQTQRLSWGPVERQFEMHFNFGRLLDEYLQPLGNADMLSEIRCVAFAGIARPQGFFAMLKEHGADVLARFAFRDHHIYTEDEITHLIARARHLQAEWLLCTEKDLVKIQELLPVLEAEFKAAGVRLAAVDLQVEIDRENELLNALKKILTKQKNGIILGTQFDRGVEQSGSSLGS